MPLSKKISQIIKYALAEDIGGCDITTSLSISRKHQSQAAIFAKEKGILCGIEIAEEVFKQVDKKICFKALKKDTNRLKKGEKIALIKGETQSILAAERVVLNFLSLLSGVATSTNMLVDKTKNTKVKIMDTRKTTPLLRELEKYAVKTGGGINHRGSLAEGIIVKDNHLKAGKYFYRGRINEKKIEQLIARLREKTKLKIEIEIEDLKQFKEIIKYNPDIVLLDNFSLKDIKHAVRYRNENFPKITLEASGGINLNNAGAAARAGVDFISVGAITHSPKAIDFSLEIL